MWTQRKKDRKEHGTVTDMKKASKQEQKHEVRKVHDEWNVGSLYAYFVCSSIKFQTKYIGAVESITVPFFLEGVLYIKRTSHVCISVSTRMTLER